MIQEPRMRYKSIYQAIVIGFFVLNIVYLCYSISKEHARNVWEREMREAHEIIRDRRLRQ